MYVKGESWDQALESYMACNHWQQVFCMTTQLKYTPEQQLEVARKVGGMYHYFLLLLLMHECVTLIFKTFIN